MKRRFIITLLSISLAANGIVFIKNGETIKGESYEHLLDRLNEVIKNKRLAKQNLFQHDNAPANSSIVAASKIYELKCKLLLFNCTTYLVTILLCFLTSKIGLEEENIVVL